MHKNKGFSLIENMIIVVVLGIIILLLLPKIFHFQSKTTKQLRVRKAITNYQVVLTKEFMNTSGLRDTEDFRELIRTKNYSGIVDRFDIKSSNCNANACTFITKSGMRWVIDDPSRALISLNESQNPNLNLAANDNNTTVFVIPFEIINGNLKVMFNKNSNDATLKAAISKTLNFINE